MNNDSHDSNLAAYMSAYFECKIGGIKIVQQCHSNLPAQCEITLAQL